MKKYKIERSKDMTGAAYSRIPETPLFDGSLSLVAKGVFACLAANEGIVDFSEYNATKDEILEALQELLEHGYIEEVEDGDIQ